MNRLRYPLMMAVMTVLAAAAPGQTATGSGTLINPTAVEDCSSSDGTCSSEAVANPDGSFSGSVSLDSPDSFSSRSVRYSIASPRYRVAFDLASPVPEAEVVVTLHLDEASASWTKDHLDVFGGTHSASSGAEVSFIFFGAQAPEGCGCGWPALGINDTVVIEAQDAGADVSITDTVIRLRLTARNSNGGNLPAGHYEAFLHGYAMAQLVGTGDWGTLDASMSGRVMDITISTPTLATKLALSLDGTGSRRSLTALLTDSEGVPLNNKTISFFADGSPLGSATTADGLAILPLQGRYRGGSHLFGAEFAGDASHGFSSAEVGS